MKMKQPEEFLEKKKSLPEPTLPAFGLR